MTIWSILRPLETFYGHLLYFVVIWYISPRFGILYQEKSGNPAALFEARASVKKQRVALQTWIGRFSRE
jgi:hypothetical protein